MKLKVIAFKEKQSNPKEWTDVLYTEFFIIKFK